MENKLNINKIIPIMLAFFTMGFVDLVGIATNHVKEDFTLSDTVANTFSVCPSKHDSDTCRTCYPQLNLR